MKLPRKKKKSFRKWIDSISIIRINHNLLREDLQKEVYSTFRKRFIPTFKSTNFNN